MTVTLPEPVELDQRARRRGGLLESSLPAPEGWQNGGVGVAWHGCGEPIVRDKCLSAIDEPHRTDTAEYSPFPIEQGATCSTLSRIDQEAHALDRLESTTEWALGRQLATDVVGLGQPSLADAELIGAYTGTESIDDRVTAAIGCLEQAAADTGFGAEWVIHSSIRGLSYLWSAGLVSRGVGGTLVSPSGATVIASTGYPSPDPLRFWATGRVWAGVDAPVTFDGVHRRMNDHTGWALRSGIVVFNPCINLAADVAVIPCSA